MFPAKAQRRKGKHKALAPSLRLPLRLCAFARESFMKTLLLILLLPLTLHAQTPNKKLAAEVKAEFLHAWNGYKKYAWGHDDLKPLSKTHHDWYPQPLLMTAVDSLDTMILMDLDEEAAATKEYILNNLSFDKDIEVQNFE